MPNRMLILEDKNGFYVYAKPNLCDPKSIVKYVSRYLGRPVIALSRIDSYDGETVTFHYNKHEDNSFMQKALPAHYFLTEDDDLGDDEFEEGFYIDLF